MGIYGPLLASTGLSWATTGHSWASTGHMGLSWASTGLFGRLRASSGLSWASPLRTLRASTGLTWTSTALYLTQPASDGSLLDSLMGFLVTVPFPWLPRSPFCSGGGSGGRGRRSPAPYGDLFGWPHCFGRWLEPSTLGILVYLLRASYFVPVSRVSHFFVMFS